MSNKEKRDIDLTDCGEDSWYEPREVVDKGQLMTWQQAKTLEEQLGVDSNNAYNRLLLLGYYEKRVGTNKKNADGYFRHLDWFLREHPGHPFLSYSTFRPDKPDLQRTHQLTIMPQIVASRRTKQRKICCKLGAKQRLNWIRTTSFGPSNWRSITCSELDFMRIYSAERSTRVGHWTTSRQRLMFMSAFQQ
jgi:hypothetical protein